MSRTVDRIEREAGVSGLAAILAERIAPTDLQSLLLEVYRMRASRRRPSDVLADYEANRFVQPSTIAPARILEWEQLAFAHLPDEFEVVTLSPVCPLGTCAAVAPVDPTWSVATVRNTELLSDATNVLALECAVRRRKLLTERAKSTEAVHLAASHRVVRPQKFDEPWMVPHFSLAK